MNEGLKTSTILLAIGCLLVVIGIGVVLYGLSIITPFHEKSFNRQEAEEVIPGIRNEIGHWIDVQNENDRRKAQAIQSANIARPYMVSGFVIAVIGILPFILGLIQRKSEVANYGAKQVKEVVLYCQHCGSKYISNSISTFCENCGNKLTGN